jgi:hypothetical protein
MGVDAVHGLQPLEKPFRARGFLTSLVRPQSPRLIDAGPRLKGIGLKLTAFLDPCPHGILGFEIFIRGVCDDLGIFAEYNNF